MARKKKTKPRSKPKPPSRMFEELIARIESTLVPQGAVVKSPDHVKDKITGSMREVDGSIRYQIGSVPVLITIECRKRGTKDDARWIEQLKSKKEDIGALQTIAVSWRGFGKPAVKKAASYGIELRGYQELTVDEIPKLQARIRVTCLYVEYKIPKVLVGLDPPVLGWQLSTELAEAMKNDSVKTKFVFAKSDGFGLTLNDLLESYERQHGPIDDGMVLGEVRSTDISVVFQKGLAYCPTLEGNKDIASMLLSVTAEYKQAVVPLSNASRYVSPDNKVFSHVAVCDVESAGVPNIVQGQKRFELIISEFPLTK